MIRISEQISLDERALAETFIRASGPGGQNVNKVASAVQLRLDLANSGLPEQVRARLARLAGKRLTQTGAVVITSQRHRSQERNRTAAMETLVRLIRRAAAVPAKRVPTRPTAASRIKRERTKKHRSRIKQQRRATIEQG